MSPVVEPDVTSVRQYTHWLALERIQFGLAWDAILWTTHATVSGEFLADHQENDLAGLELRGRVG